MSMGNAACTSVVIDNSKLGKLIGKKTAETLLGMLDKVSGSELIDSDLDHMFNPHNYTGEVDGVSGEAERTAFLKKLDKAVTSAMKAIRAKTGITAYLSYHDPDTGDSYDDVQGFFVELRYEECIKPTPAYHKLETSGIAGIAHYTVFC